MTMENMGEIPDQQINDSTTTPGSSSGAEEEYTVKQEEFVAITPKQEFVEPTSDSVSVSPGVAESGGGEIDSPNIVRSEAIPVNMIDSHEFRTQMGDLTYQTLNGRISPSYSPTNNYATLTPLQPLPPISTVSDKFQQIQTTSMGNFQFINNGLTSAMDMNNYSYDKMMNTMTPAAIPMSMMSNMNGYANQTLTPYSYNVNVSVGVTSQNGLPSPKSMELKPVLSPSHNYEPYPRSLTATPSRIHSPVKIKQCDSPIPMMQGSALNGLHLSPTGMESQSPQSFQSGSPQHDRSGLDGTNGKELEEINTKELAQRISSELKRYSIPQAVFAQRVLCRSQGTLSDLLRNPKPWSKLKSGRETFRRMWKWLQEPEFQRMSALRLAACLQPSEVEGQGWNEGGYPEIKEEPGSPGLSTVSNGSGQSAELRTDVSECGTGTALLKLNTEMEQGLKTNKRKDPMETTPPQENRGPKKPRLVFTDIQRRTLHAIFKETKRPSKEMQATIAQQLGLEVTTVANFFMNARRRSVDKWRDDNGVDNRENMSKS